MINLLINPEEIPEYISEETLWETLAWHPKNVYWGFLRKIPEKKTVIEILERFSESIRGAIFKRASEKKNTCWNACGLVAVWLVSPSF